MQKQTLLFLVAVKLASNHYTESLHTPTQSEIKLRTKKDAEIQRE